MDEVNFDVLKQLQCIVLPGSSILCQPSLWHIHENAYKFWKTYMGGTLQYEITVDEPPLLSDKFINQHEIMCLVNDTEVVGIFMHRWLDLNHQSIEDYSYFLEELPEEALNYLRRHKAQQLMIMSNLTIATAWRKTKIGRGVSDLLTRLSVLRFLTSTADNLLTYSRNDRKTNRLFYNHGGKPVLKGFTAHGIPSDIIAFKQTVDKINIPEPLVKLADELWDKRHSALITSLPTSVAIPANVA